MSEIKISTEELAGALRRMAMETGSLICLGCGYEHGCSVHGCAVLREAAELLERRRWISVEERLPDSPKNVLVSGGNYVDMASWQGEQGAFVRFDPGTLIGMECPGIRYWMPLPEPPEEE